MKTIKCLRRTAAVATVVSGLVAATAAVAAGPAQAAQYNLTKYAGGPAVAASTTFTATSSEFALGNSTGSSTYFSCSSSSLSGVTDAIFSGGPQAGLSITSGSFGGCTEAGTLIKATASFATPWQLTPLSGTTTPFDDELTHFVLTFTCGSGSATFTGTLNANGTSSLQERNDLGPYSSGSQIVLTSTSSVTKSGTGCAALPSTVYLTSTYALATVGGTPASATNNLWENYS